MKIAVQSAGAHCQFINIRGADEDSLSDIAQYDLRIVFECFHCFQMS